jgi:2-keto-4-pentenoate hydratase/2-oxohepta-3-ene-1,7-dioic acid hydratase in catechol pathway
VPGPSDPVLDVRLATFTLDAVTRVGLVDDDRIVDLLASGVPADLVTVLSDPTAVEAARDAIGRRQTSIPLADVRLEPPIRRPGKFLGVGANYVGRTDDPVEHAARLAERRASGVQHWFNKQVTCITGPLDPIVLPKVSTQVIYENELAFVIGRRCRDVPLEHALDAIAGYLICNDVTTVDWTQISPTATVGKSFDTHGPIGPWVVTPDEVGDPQALGIRTYVSGVERDRGNTSEMVASCDELIAFVSRAMTLEPGDIITTGTPTPGREFLQPGDVVRCEVDRLGYLENPVKGTT